MGTKHTAEFRQESVRVALSRGLARKQIGADFGVVFSTLSRWMQLGRQTPEKPAAQSGLECENAQLWKENRLLREERGGEENRAILPIGRLCQIMNVSPRGYRACRSRPISQSQRTDTVLLAHIREQHQLSPGSYGRPRMTEELGSGPANIRLRPSAITSLTSHQICLTVTSSRKSRTE